MSRRKEITIITYLGGPIDAAEDRGVRWRQIIKPQYNIDLKSFLDEKFPKLAIKLIVQDPVEATEIAFARPIDKVHEYLDELRKFNEVKFVEEVFHKIILPDIQMVKNLDQEDVIGFGTVYFAPDTPTSGTHCEIWEGAYRRDIPFHVVSPTGLLGTPAWIQAIILRKGGKIFYNFPQLMAFLRVWLVEEITEKMRAKRETKPQES